MKLTKELKKKIDDWFDSKSEEEVYEILKGYGLVECKSKLISKKDVNLDKTSPYFYEEIIFPMYKRHCIDFGKLISERNIESKTKDMEYTLDELKQEVDKFRDYILKVSQNNNCKISVNFNYVSNNISDLIASNETSSITTHINIY